ncbi:hypothetical protein BDQ12DRAFT_675846 [Crucibulum laeve]|uniref:Uncharacterized protein n=1 Tax=Crucibulum laeve TaxID=68775 RepID=A0A5C3MRL9_9AGAR|nr:hypothetical protein BDQ12DRAFT_675846 [Crucibulum laeve]
MTTTTTAAAAETQETAGKYLFTFPPFPAPPSGVKIVPFKDFTEYGIQVAPGPGDQEVDTRGIPTVVLKHSHTTDVCKTNTKRLKRKLEQEKVKRVGGLGKKLSIWEEWEDKESTRNVLPIDPHQPRIDKLHHAATDFRNGRPWPPPQPLTGVIDLFQQFRKFIGVPENVVSAKKKKKDADEEEFREENDDMSEDGDIDADMNGAASTIAVDEQVPRIEELSKEEERAFLFLDKPEKALKIYLSSYCTNKGYIWAEPNLENIPRILRFFIDFLIRNRVFPESERGFKRALQVIDLASIELPMIGKIAKLWPDDFSEGSAECWGRNAEGYKRIIANLDVEDSHEDRQTKRQKIDEETPAKVEDVVMEEVPTNDTSNSSQTQDEGWGSSTTGGWGNTENSGAWGTIDLSAETGWGSPSADADITAWAPPPAKSLMPLLGPTALPITHTTGIVEQSMRRVKAIIPPPANIPKSAHASEPNADSVDAELERRFAKVVLSPWLDWEAGEIPHMAKPKILASSRGPVVDPNETTVAPAAPDPPAEGLKSHDPLHDDITVLVDPSTLESVVSGLGFAATWTQLARVQDLEPGEKKKKKKGKGKKEPIRYWYLEECTKTIPSFWTRGVF